MKSICQNNFLLFFINSIILILLIGGKELQVSCKRFDKSIIRELPGSIVEVKNVDCEFFCDRACALDPNCVATSFSKNGTCKVIQYGGVTLEDDPDSISKTRGIFLKKRF